MFRDFSLEIVLPVYNEEKILKGNVLAVKRFLDKHKFKFVISIVDNGSNDCSYEIAKELERKHERIYAYRLKQKGRGGAIRYRMLGSVSALIGYMDIDLSSSLFDFLKLCKEIQNGYDVAIGSRIIPGAQVKRSLLRELFSRSYCTLVRKILDIPIKDYQCGFKLFQRGKIIPLLSQVKNNRWFFDTEILYYAYRKGLRIKEVPIEWKERKRGTVRIIPTAIEDIRGLLELRLKSQNISK